MVKIQPGLILAYNDIAPRPRRSSSIFPDQTHRPPPVGLYSGLITKGSRKKLVKSINLLIAISRQKKAIHFDSKKEFLFRVNFITLTLPAPQGSISDKDLKKLCLKIWLEHWKDKLPGFSYVWRAERQGNGNLHFHILTNRYIHYKDIRDSWNKAMARTTLIDDFERVNGHRTPNSTDVHAVKAITNLAAYVAKYMSKKEKEGQPVEGRVWDCSKNLKAKDVCSWAMAAADIDTFENLLKNNPGKSFTTDHCGGVKLTEKDMHSQLPEEWKNEYRAYLSRIRGDD